MVRRHGKDTPVYVVADAYDGARIRDAITDMVHYAAGEHPLVVQARGREGDVQLDAGGHASLLAYVGHDGLMEFEVEEPDHPADGARPRAAVVLACESHSFFQRILGKAGAEPLVLTYGLMSPEAYTLDAILQHWFGGDSPAQVRESAAAAYDHYQHCGLNGARRLFGAADRSRAVRGPTGTP
jgi:hypothetical protein